MICTDETVRFREDLIHELRRLDAKTETIIAEEKRQAECQATRKQKPGVSIESSNAGTIAKIRRNADGALLAVTLGADGSPITVASE